MTVADELRADLETLLGQSAVSIRLEWPSTEDNGGMFGVWADFEGEEELIGAGESMDEAYADAIATVRGWGAP